jgi:hypothetical protein
MAAFPSHRRICAGRGFATSFQRGFPSLMDRKQNRSNAPPQKGFSFIFEG